MFCPKCGKQVDENIKFCGYCGADLREFSEEPARREDVPPARKDSGAAARPSSPKGTTGGPSRPQGTSSATKGILIALIAALVVVGAILAAVILKKNAVKKEEPAAASATSVSVSETVKPTPTTAASSETTAAVSEEETSASSSETASAATSEVATSEEEEETMPESGFDALAAWAKGVYNGTMQLVTSDVSNYPEVKLYFNYSDSSGNPITLSSPTAGIKESIEGGAVIEREIIKIEQLEGNEGIGIELLADKSDSMSGDMPRMQQIMRDFVDSLDYAMGDHVEIITFDSYIMYMCSDTNNVEYLRNGIASMTPYGMTALYDALMTGVENAGSREGANVVIAFTDGMDNESRYTYEEVIARAKVLDVPIYLVGTDGSDTDILQRICLETGGEYWNIHSINDLQDIYRRFYDTQKHMYCVTYKSDPAADPYKERTVSCAITDQTCGNVLEAVPFTAVKKAEEIKHDSRYEIIAGDISWTEANNRALANGGHLATITSQDEMNELVEMAKKSGLEYLWIGGYTSVRNNQAFGHWTTGEPFDYTAWFPGEPSRNDKDGTPEFYLMLWNVNGEWSWNDQRDNVLDSGLDYFKGKIGYICEYEQ